MLLAIRTTSGRESAVVSSIVSRVVSKHIPVKAIVQSEQLRGYIFIEAEDSDAIEQAVRGIPHVRGIVAKEITVDQIERFIIPEKEVVKVEENDVVEIISGPFKGEKAKVTRVDELKNELTVELLESAIPIPITIPISAVRIEKKAKEGKEKSS